MDILSFLIIGLLSGWIASILVKGQGSGMLSDIVIGVVGAFVGGFVFKLFDILTFGFAGTLFMSVIGSVLFLLTIGVGYKRRRRKN